MPAVIGNKPIKDRLTFAITIRIYNFDNKYKTPEFGGIKMYIQCYYKI